MLTFDEDDVRRWVPKDSKLVDAILVSPEQTVLIESKAGLYDEDILTCGNREWLSQNTRPVRAAIAQLWTVAGHLESADEAPAEARNGALFGLVVTNIDLHMGSVTRLATMYPPGKLEPSDATQRRGSARLPPGRIYVVGAAAYERLTECVARQGLKLGPFLEACAAEDGDPHTSRLGIDEHLTDAKMPSLASPVAHRAREEAIQWAEELQRRKGELKQA